MKTVQIGGALGAAVILAASSAVAQNQTQLDPIDVNAARENAAGVQQTTAGPVDGYRALTARSATKTDTPLERVPQSIQALPRKVIEDQGAVSTEETLRNVSGVQPSNALNPAQVYPKIRGFSGEVYIDGLPNYYGNGARDLLVNVERLEVLKGPSSVLYGGGMAIGGIVNVVSKMPTLARHAEAGLTVGSNGFISPWFDINQPLTKDGTVLFRVTGQYEKAGSEINVVERRSYAINPTLTFTNNAGTTLTLQGHLSQRKQPDYSGLPAVGTLDRSLFSIRRNMFVGNARDPDSLSRLGALTVRLDHTFNDVWSFNAIARASRSNYREYSQYLTGNNPALPGSSLFQLANGYLGEDTTEVSGSANIFAKFAAGVTKNTLLFGVDYNRVTDKGLLTSDAFATFNLADMSLANPGFPVYVRPPDSLFTTFSKIDNIYRTMGATAQIQSTIFERLHLLAGLRLANVDIVSRELALFAPQAYKSSDTKLLPRIGAVFDVAGGVSVYAAYSEGLRAMPFFAAGGVSPKPEGARNIEGGLKLNTAFGLSGTIALFELTRTNVAVTGPFGVAVQSGEQMSRGFEADLIWRPIANLSVLASFAHVDAKVTKDTNIVNIGAPLTGVPRNSGRLWANWSFDGALKGLSVGAGLYAASAQSVVLGQTWRTPGFATWDARAAYQYKNWTFALTGKNLADRQYFVPYSFFEGRVAPAPGRTIYATISAKL